jgi:hypothetical protein
MELNGQLHVPAAVARPPGSNWKGGWVGRMALARNRSLVVQPVASHITYRALAIV